MGIKEIVSIDIGSTNSQMAVKYVNTDNNKPQGWDEGFLPNNLISDGEINKNIPTILIEWVGKGARPAKWEREIPAGNKVFQLINDSFEGDIKVSREFKKDLFYTQEEKDKDPQKAKKYKEACESTKKFLTYLMHVKNNRNKSNTLAPDEYETYITVPVRSRNDDFAFIKKIAEEIGWKNIEIIDEAKAALDFAIYKPDSEIMKGIEKLTIHDKINVLLVDIGGSTTDLLLAEIRPDGNKESKSLTSIHDFILRSFDSKSDSKSNIAFSESNGSYKSDYKAQWPPTGTTDTLGCIDVDKKIVELLLEKGYLIKSLVDSEINSTGYKVFSDFKETWSEAVKTNGSVSNLRDLLKFAVDTKNGKFANNFRNYDGELGKTEFEEVIHDYIIELQKAIRSVLEHEGITEEDLDFVVLTGGGSEMYGIEEMILGELDVEDPLNFTKIKKNPSACIHGCVENPSAACCLGNLLEKSKIKCRNHINGCYTAKVEIYTGRSSVIANYSGLSQKKTNGKPSLPSGTTYRGGFEFNIVKDLDALPVDLNKKVSCNISLNAGDNIIFRITIYRQNADEDKKYIEASWLYRSERSWGQWFSDLFTSKTETRSINLENEIHISVSENRKIKVKPNYKAPGFDTNLATTKEVEF